jgi:hypothetical protein
LFPKTPLIKIPPCFAMYYIYMEKEGDRKGSCPVSASFVRSSMFFYMCVCTISQNPWDIRNFGGNRWESNPPGTARAPHSVLKTTNIRINKYLLCMVYFSTIHSINPYIRRFEHCPQNHYQDKKTDKIN